ncbi:hypothetical protein CEXT_233831 [Caerostris extrusa]|uniref:Uncharacterized protein n=1 Tax=Caerostris extrusa TaxID=172846 RepID=A0AAV4PX87_CAEEX|nr:hypothetical protein CEXT_233831 [Caerostris extrusa]
MNKRSQSLRTLKRLKRYATGIEQSSSSSSSSSVFMNQTTNSEEKMIPELPGCDCLQWSLEEHNFPSCRVESEISK